MLLADISRPGAGAIGKFREVAAAKDAHLAATSTDSRRRYDQHHFSAKDQEECTHASTNDFDSEGSNGIPRIAILQVFKY
jgi:hypothetical protein